MILHFDFDLPCRTSPRRCSRCSHWGWACLKTINIKGRFIEKSMMIEL